MVKVESPSGDVIRQIASPQDRGMSGLYTFVNVGKRNVCVDLNKPEGLELALGLVEQADVVIENFRPGVADRLGIGWQAIHGRNTKTPLLPSCNLFVFASRKTTSSGMANYVTLTIQNSACSQRSHASRKAKKRVMVKTSRLKD